MWREIKHINSIGKLKLKFMLQLDISNCILIFKFVLHLKLSLITTTLQYFSMCIRIAMHTIQLFFFIFKHYFIEIDLFLSVKHAIYIMT